MKHKQPINQQLKIEFDITYALAENLEVAAYKFFKQSQIVKQLLKRKEENE